MTPQHALLDGGELDIPAAPGPLSRTAKILTDPVTLLVVAGLALTIGFGLQALAIFRLDASRLELQRYSSFMNQSAPGLAERVEAGVLRTAGFEDIVRRAAPELASDSTEIHLEYLHVNRVLSDWREDNKVIREAARNWEKVISDPPHALSPALLEALLAGSRRTTAWRTQLTHRGASPAGRRLDRITIDVDESAPTSSAMLTLSLGEPGSSHLIESSFLANATFVSDERLDGEGKRIRESLATNDLIDGSGELFPSCRHIWPSVELLPVPAALSHLDYSLAAATSTTSLLGHRVSTTLAFFGFVLFANLTLLSLSLSKEAGRIRLDESRFFPLSATPLKRWVVGTTLFAAVTLPCVAFITVLLQRRAPDITYPLFAAGCLLSLLLHVSIVTVRFPRTSTRLSALDQLEGVGAA